MAFIFITIVKDSQSQREDEKICYVKNAKKSKRMYQ